MQKQVPLTTICIFLYLTGCQSPKPEIISPNPKISLSPKVSQISIKIPEKPLTLPTDNSNSITSGEVQTYLKRLTTQGFSPQNQGVWIQSNDTLISVFI